MKGKANILLVDDQPARLLSYDVILRDIDENLVHAHSGTEALKLLMAREFAVILLDVNMPDMDGLETASLIHQHPRYEKTPIIFVTGVHVTDLDRLKGYKLGAFDYVYIPVVPEILRAKVSVLVELYNKRRRTANGQPRARTDERRTRRGEQRAVQGKRTGARQAQRIAADGQRCAAAGRPAQGRVSGDAGARTAQSAGAVAHGRGS